MSQQHAIEVSAGERFAFGDNWTAFLTLLDDDRIREAEISLRAMLHLDSLQGLRFLDIGSGSGLFSLAARRLGARVLSFDFDPASVACTRELRRRYFPDDEAWNVLSGSALEAEFMATLGEFDVVYSWGVLHHTGRMWMAIEQAISRVAPGGRLFIAIYNDQGVVSRRWLWVKRTYNRLPGFLRPVLVFLAFLWLYWRPLLKDLLLLRPGWTFRAYSRGRGMSLWRDMVDWVGGYPFEVAKPEEIFDFCKARGFQLETLKTCNDLGCNEFVLVRTG